jgi:hypothetical protein
MHGSRRTPEQWIAAGAIAFPAVVLLHELGHYLAARSLGFSAVRLRYMSVSVPELELYWSRFTEPDALAASGPLVWPAVLPIAAGVAATYLTLLLCCLLVARGHTHPLIVWVGLAAPLRFYLSVGTVRAWLAGQEIPLTAEDESRLAAAFGVPHGALVAIGIVVSVAASVWLLHRVPERSRVVVPYGTIGLVLGMLLYGGLVGPLLLP